MNDQGTYSGTIQRNDYAIALTGRRVAHNDRAETQKNESRSLTASQSLSFQA